MPSTTSAWRAFGTLKLTSSRFGLRAGWDTTTLFFASVRTLAAPRICPQCFLSAGTVRSIVTVTFIVKANVSLPALQPVEAAASSNGIRDRVLKVNDSRHVRNGWAERRV